MNDNSGLHCEPLWCSVVFATVAQETQTCWYVSHWLLERLHFMVKIREGFIKVVRVGRVTKLPFLCQAAFSLLFNIFINCFIIYLAALGLVVAYRIHMMLQLLSGLLCCWPWHLVPWPKLGPWSPTLESGSLSLVSKEVPSSTLMVLSTLYSSISFFLPFRGCSG